MNARAFKVFVAIVGIVSLVSMSCSVMAQPLMDPQQRLLAKRAAQVDAYRNLAERIKGLQIDSQTYVRDFVAESDQVRTSFDTFIKGIKVTGQPRYLPDGTCEVDVQITLKELITALQEIAKFNRFGHKYKFSKMTQFVQEKAIRATGYGAPREDNLAPVSTPTTVSSPTRGIVGWDDVSARGRLMAERAAKVDAYRNLAETVKGIRISGQTYVRDFVAESDYVQTALDTFIKGARQVGPYRYLPYGEVEVAVEVTVREVVKELKTIRKHLVQRGWGWRRDIWQDIKFEQIVAVYPNKIVQATGNGVVPKKYRLAPANTAYNPAVAPTWTNASVSAVGTGVPPDGVTGTEGKLMAVRAAELDARRQLLEKVYGVHIDAQTTVKDYVTQNDQVKAEVESFLAGAQVSEPKYLSDGSVEVTASLPLEGMDNVIK